MELRNGNKIVRIRKNGGNEKDILAMYIQTYTEHDGQPTEQVLETKNYSSVKRAERWARKTLEI